MTLNTKKVAAISAAVVTYIKTEEEAAYLAASAKENQGVAAAKSDTASSLNIWGAAGRTNQMQLHSMIQMRVFK